MRHGEKEILALGMELGEAYGRLDQAESALFAYYHARLEQTRQGVRSTPDMDESLPGRQAVKAAYNAVLTLHRALGEMRRVRLQDNSTEQVGMQE